MQQHCPPETMRKARRHAGVTNQETVAEGVGVSRATVTRWEHIYGDGAGRTHALAFAAWLLLEGKWPSAALVLDSINRKHP